MDRERIIRAFVASPNDVLAEREALSSIVDELNLTWADFIGIRIELLRWETHSYPSLGADAQEVVNRQIGDDYELFVGILWTRLGTPTPRATSGTVEEFERAFERRKQGADNPEVMFYLKTAEPPEEKEKHSQSDEIEKFTRRLKGLGIYYWQFATLREFRQATRIHLSRFVQQLRQRGVASPRLKSFRRPERDNLFDYLAQAKELVKRRQDAALSVIELFIALTKVFKQHDSEVKRANAGLQNVLQPGFRKPPGGSKKILENLSRAMTNFGDRVDKEAPRLFDAYEDFLECVGKLFVLFAPVAPIRGDYRKNIEVTFADVEKLKETLLATREAHNHTREVIAAWDRMAPEFNRSKRRALAALDGMDGELTGALRITRELGLSLDELLDKWAD